MIREIWYLGTVFRKKICLSFIMIVPGLSLISAAIDLSSYQQGKDIHRAIAKQSDEVCQETDPCRSSLSKNDRVCPNDFETWSMNVSDADKFVKPDQNDLLTWKHLSHDMHDPKDRVQVNEQKNVKESTALHMGAIIGPMQIYGFYDQTGDSKYSYQFVNELGKPISDVIWDVQGHDIDKNDIWFQNNKITWNYNLEPKTYWFTIVATKDGKSWQTNVVLTIKNNYFIHGQTSFEVDKDFTSNEKSRSGSARYQLYQNDRSSKHQNFSWDVKDCDGKCSREEIDIDWNGKLTWKNIVSDTQFRVVAISKNDLKELASLIIRLHVKQHRYKIQGQINFTCIVGDDGQSGFAFYVDDQQVQNKHLVWKLSDINAGDEELSVKESVKEEFSIDNGLVRWTDGVPFRHDDHFYTFRVWASWKADENVMTSILCNLKIADPYTISGNETIVTNVNQAGCSSSTYILMRDGKEVEKYHHKIKYKIDDFGKNLLFYNNEINQIEWKNDTDVGQYPSILRACIGSKEITAASIRVNFQVVKGYFAGEGNITVSTNKSKEWKHQFFIWSNVEWTDQVTWTLNNDLNGSLTIKNGILHYEHQEENVPDTYQITIGVKHSTENVWAEETINFTIKSKYYIEGHRDLGDIYIYHDTVYRGCRYVLKKWGNPMSDFEWRVVWSNGLTISLFCMVNDQFCWKPDIVHPNRDYLVYLEAWSKNVRYARVPIKFHTVGTFEEVSWDILSYVCQSRNAEAVRKYFGLQSRKELIGKTKKINFKGNQYDARIVALDHDNKKGGWEAALTFELMQVLSDENKERISVDWTSEETSDYKISDIRKKMQEYSKVIEVENDFTMATVKKETARGHAVNDVTFNPKVDFSYETGYLASLSEMTAKKFADYTIYHEESVFDYYRNAKIDDKIYLKYDWNGKPIDDHLYSYWLRSPSAPYSATKRTTVGGVWGVSTDTGLWMNESAFEWNANIHHYRCIIFCFSL